MLTRQEQLAAAAEAGPGKHVLPISLETIEVRFERGDDGRWRATSDAVPGLLVEADTMLEAEAAIPAAVKALRAQAPGEGRRFAVDPAHVAIADRLSEGLAVTLERICGVLATRHEHVDEDARGALVEMGLVERVDPGWPGQWLGATKLGQKVALVRWLRITGSGDLVPGDGVRPDTVVRLTRDLAASQARVAEIEALLRRVEAATRKGSGSEAVLAIDANAGEAEWAASVILVAHVRAALDDLEFTRLAAQLEEGNDAS